MSRTTFFTSETFDFLRDLAHNNERAWFAANRDRYERHVREPALAFIAAAGPPLKAISQQFRADPRPVGGSLFRIHRDVRFSRDKSPYKTHVGIRFPHVEGRDVHAPGYYLHIDPGEVFFGCGVWHPDGATLTRIREAIATRPERWKKTRDERRFRGRFQLGGASLKRAPRGFDPAHPWIEDLKRKDFVAIAELDAGVVTGSGLVAEFVTLCRSAAPFQRFLCETLGVKY